MITEAECKNYTTEGMNYNSIMLGANKILLVLEPLQSFSAEKIEA
jgi:hypothetical protein